MRSEDLFLAISSVEDSRLARSEKTVSSSKQKEDKTMKTSPGRILRNLLIAAVLVSLLAVTAYAVTGFLIFDSPEEMVTAIFGDETGFDHSDGGEKFYLDSGLAVIEPTFDRVPADATVVAEDIAPHVDAVGQSIRWNGFTLTVDAFMYDSTTKCGFVTYLLENPNGVSGYKLQPNGEIWYDGAPDPVQVNQYGYPHIIQEKTTDTCLAVTYYFKWNPKRGDDLEISLQSKVRYTPDAFEALIAEDVEELKQKMTPEEVIETIRQQMDDESFKWAFQGMTEEQIAEQCYTEIVAREVAERLEAEGTSEAITIPLTGERALEHITAGNGSSIITPISVCIDITDLDFLHTDEYENHRVHCDNMDSVVIRFNDGTEYIVFEGYTINYTFGLIELPEENVQTEVFVPPEEDPNGEGYIYVVNSHDYCLDTMMFNRIIDIEEVSAVIINGIEFPVD